MSSLILDLKYAFRMLRKQPGLSLVVAMTLALGLGLNTAIFGMLDALLLRPYQFRDYDQLVAISGTSRNGSERGLIAPGDFLEFRQRGKSFAQLVAWDAWSTSLSAGSDPERVRGFRVSP